MKKIKVFVVDEGNYQEIDVADWYDLEEIKDEIKGLREELEREINNIRREKQ